VSSDLATEFAFRDFVRVTAHDATVEDLTRRAEYERVTVPVEVILSSQHFRSSSRQGHRASARIPRILCDGLGSEARHCLCFRCKLRLQ
jgi:hypothetical protein